MLAELLLDLLKIKLIGKRSKQGRWGTTKEFSTKQMPRMRTDSEAKWHNILSRRRANTITQKYEKRTSRQENCLNQIKIWGTILLNSKVTHTLTMKFPSSSGVTMTTESCSFSSKWTCDGTPALVGSSEKRTPPAFAQPDWKEGGKRSVMYTNTRWTALKGGKKHIKPQHLAAAGGTMECATGHFTLAIT